MDNREVVNIAVSVYAKPSAGMLFQQDILQLSSLLLFAEMLLFAIFLQ